MNRYIILPKYNSTIEYTSLLRKFVDSSTFVYDLLLIRLIYANRYISLNQLYLTHSLECEKRDMKPLDFDTYLRRVKRLEKQMIIQRFFFFDKEDDKDWDTFAKDYIETEKKLRSDYKYQKSQQKYKTRLLEFEKLNKEIGANLFIRTYKGAEDIINNYTQFNFDYKRKIVFHEVVNGDYAAYLAYELGKSAMKFELFKCSLNFYQLDEDTFYLEAAHIPVSEIRVKIERLFDKGKVMNYYKEYFAPIIYVRIKDEYFDDVSAILSKSVLCNVIRVTVDGKEYFELDSDNNNQFKDKPVITLGGGQANEKDK